MINSEVMRVRTDDVLSLASSSNSQQPPVEINDEDDDDNNGNMEDSQMPIDEDATPIRT